MNSPLKEALAMELQPVAVLKSDAVPEGATQLAPGTTGGCLIGLLEAAAKGRTAAFRPETTGCPGGRAGLGFEQLKPEGIQYFLSQGSQERPGEYYKASPALAEAYVRDLPETVPSPCLLFKPLDQVDREERPVSVVFLVNADQLSGLITLASFDRAGGEPVKIRFGAGCAQSILFAMCESEAGGDQCFLGLTDPSSRLHISRDLLSFSVPYPRFLEMEANVPRSFLTKETWSTLRKRIH